MRLQDQAVGGLTVLLAKGGENGARLLQVFLRLSCEAKISIERGVLDLGQPHETFRRLEAEGRDWRLASAASVSR